MSWQILNGIPARSTLVYTFIIFAGAVVVVLRTLLLLPQLPHSTAAEAESLLATAPTRKAATTMNERNPLRNPRTTTTAEVSVKTETFKSVRKKNR